MMNKLMRVVDNLAIQFVTLPKIFNLLSTDLPTGSVKLSTGETAYWRLFRKHYEVKKAYEGVQVQSSKLLEEFKALVSSTDFLNQYGLTKSPKIDSDESLMTVFGRWIQSNPNRVDYSATGRGPKRPMLETLNMSLTNGVVFRSARGVDNSNQEGRNKAIPDIKGKLYLSDGSTNPFYFTITSPIINIAEYIGPDRLAEEIQNKLVKIVPLLVDRPQIEFDINQFANYKDRALEALVSSHPKKQAPKKRNKVEEKTTALDNLLTQSDYPRTDEEELEYTRKVKQALHELNQVRNNAGMEPIVLEEKESGPVVREDTSAVEDGTSQETSSEPGPQGDLVTSGPLIIDEPAESTSVQLDPQVAESLLDEMSAAPERDYTSSQEEVSTTSNADAEDVVERTDELPAESEAQKAEESPAAAPEPVKADPEFDGMTPFSPDEFEELSDQDRHSYLHMVESAASQPSRWSFVEKFLNSGIMKAEYEKLNSTLEPMERISHARYLGRVILQLQSSTIDAILGKSS